jgi:phenylalanyl-tRNA synthetase beta chain
MEYSLKRLNENINFENLQTLDFIEKLNVIGFEIDDIKNEYDSFNNFINKIRLEIKIPANRQDLLIETFLIKEIQSIFTSKDLERWKKSKTFYIKYLQKLYKKNYILNSIQLNKKKDHLIIYNIELTNLTLGASPNWIKQKLIDYGSQPKNNIEDLLSLVYHEWGQPFSLSCVEFSKFQLLNIFANENYELMYYIPDKNTFIPSQNFSDTIDNSTHRFFISSIWFEKEFFNKQKTKVFSQEYRTSFLENFKFAFQRLLTLLELVYSCSIRTNIFSNLETTISFLKPDKIIPLRIELLKKILNINTINLEVFSIANLKIICKTKSILYFSISNLRSDLSREIDLIEEYSRFIGYKNFQEIFPNSKNKTKNDSQKSISFIKQFFINYGFNEILNNSLDDLNDSQSIMLLNPLNNEFTYLKTNLLQKLFNTFEKNIKQNNKLNNYFEIGRIFRKSKNKKIIEIEQISSIFQLQFIKKDYGLTSEWFRAKGFVENFLLAFGYKNLETIFIEKDDYLYHPTKSIAFKLNNKIIAKFGEVNPIVLNNINSKFATYIFESNLEFLKPWRLNSSINLFNEYSKYPSIRKDLSCIVPKIANFSDILKFIKNNLSFLKRSEIFDVYFDSNDLYKASISISLEFQSENETLTNEIIDNEIRKLKNLLSINFAIEFKD